MATKPMFGRLYDRFFRCRKARVNHYKSASVRRCTVKDYVHNGHWAVGKVPREFQGSRARVTCVGEVTFSKRKLQSHRKLPLLKERELPYRMKVPLLRSEKSSFTETFYLMFVGAAFQR